MVWLEDDKYIVKDSTSGGMTSRVTRAEWYFKSVWDKDLNLLELYLDGKLAMDILSNKNHHNYYRVVKAKGRHLKEIKEYLGILVPEAPPSKVKVIWQSSYYGSYSDVKIEECVVTYKMVGEHRKSHMRFTESTPEKEAIALEYIEKLKEFEKYRDGVFKALFGK